MIWVLISILFLIVLFLVYIIWRLNKYISYVLEDKIEELEDRINQLEQSLKIALGENLIRENGRIKKPYV